MLHSGCTSHMTGSKAIMSELRPNDYDVTVTYDDMSTSQVTGLGKVVVAWDITLVDIMLVETLLIIYFQSVLLERWALPSLLIIIFWYSCGESL